jgi:hypothetical protein
MDRPAGFAPKPSKSFNRSELIRSIYERFQRDRRERRRGGAEAKTTHASRKPGYAVLDEIAGALERGKRLELRGVGSSPSKKSANGKNVIHVPVKRW